MHALKSCLHVFQMIIKITMLYRTINSAFFSDFHNLCLEETIITCSRFTSWLGRLDLEFMFYF